MLVGGYQMFCTRLSTTTLVLLCGYALAPMAASTFGRPGAIDLAPALVPFAVLIAASGAAWLLSGPRPIARAAGIGLLVLIPVQFAIFHQQALGAARVTTTGPAHP
jgi:hypothetical protein